MPTPTPTGLYIHVPFCRLKCGYCDFYSIAATEETRARYAARVRRMLESVPFGRQVFSTVYFGGGTPPLLGAGGIVSILEAVRRFHILKDGAEITIECNPGEVEEEFFRRIAAAGVNRVSFGLQTTDPKQLLYLGRRHTAADAGDAVNAARRAGIDRLSLDLMLALPRQTAGQVEDSIRFCAGLDIPHISCYLLKIEPGTRFDRENAGALCPDEDGQADLYLFACEQLEKRGWRQYEISNFAWPGFESRHNLGYWKLTPYLGIGPAAHSLMAGRRFYFERELQPFLDAQDPWSLLREDGPGGDAREYLMLALRLREGIDLAEASRVHGLDGEALLDRAAPFLERGWMGREGTRLFLTRTGFLLSNTLINALLD